MTDVGFVIAGWGVILGGLALYAYALARRLRAARSAHEADPVATSPPEGEG